MPGRADLWGVGTSFDSRRWLSLNPCGFFGITCSFSVHVFAFAVTAKYLITGSFFAQVVFLVLYLPLSFMAVWSLYMAWTTNPGAVPLGARPLVTVSRSASGDMCPSEQARRRGLSRCQKCNENFKPPRAHHDSVTGRCVVKFDHYCPWVCNAVGALNHKFFFLFVFYTMNTCITAIFMIILRSIRCGYEKETPSDDQAVESFTNSNIYNATVGEEEIREDDVGGDLDETRYVFRALQSMAPSPYIYAECEEFHSTNVVLVLFCVAVTFFVFTACMMVEQIEAIRSGQGKIARMKMKVGRGGTELSRVTEEFNEMFGGNSPNVAWHWFVPLPIQFPGSMHKIVLGYEWDPTFDPMPYREDRESGVELSSTSSAGESVPLNIGGGEAGSDLPADVETGMPQTDLDEVSMDEPASEMPLEGRLKKRAVSSGSVNLPELS